eukprot:496604-Heterocapsa_arctica.AAC.1
MRVPPVPQRSFRVATETERLRPHPGSSRLPPPIPVVLLARRLPTLGDNLILLAAREREREIERERDIHV